MDDDRYNDPLSAEPEVFVQDGVDLFALDDPETEPPAAQSETPSAAAVAPLDKRAEAAIAGGATPPDSPYGTRAAEAPLALYRRYRPDIFADVIGQEHVTEPLQRALANNRVNHAYLFSGPRGCGKTTSARILARALNCATGPSPVPCGECDSCVALARGGPGSIDVIEIDAASHGGVDDARDLRERVFFAPVSSRYKIYIVDEAHMVTPAGFNALLKVVEEPPPHVKFIFATTEPDKVIGTIRSRTHHYPFRLVPPKTLSAYLGTLCEAEGVQVDPTALPLVVRAGAGSVRDSLSVLDQLLGGADVGGVSYGQAAALLGYTPDSLLDEVVDAFAAGDANGVFSCVDKVIEAGQDPRRFAEDLLRRLRDLIIVAAVPDALSTGLVDVAADQAERLQAQSTALGPGELTRAAEVIATGLTEMRGTTAPRLHLELMCARVLLPAADAGGRGVHARLDRLERRLSMTAPEAVADTSGAAGLDQPDRRGSAVGSGSAGIGEPAAVGGPPGGRGLDQLDGPAGRPTPVARESTASPAGTTATAPRAATTRTAPPAGTTSPAPRAATTRTAPPAGTTSPAPVAGTKSAEPPAGTKSARPPAGKSAPAPVGTKSTAPPAGTKSTAPPAGTTSAGPPVGAMPTALSTTEFRRLWPSILTEVKNRRRFTWILLSQNAQVVDLIDGVLTLGISNPGARDSFGRGGSEDVLREAVLQATATQVTIKVIDAGPSDPPPPPTKPAAPTPAAPPQSPRSPAAVEARQNIRPTSNHVAPAADETEPTRDDLSVEDETFAHDELLAKHLGAELIAEEPS